MQNVVSIYGNNQITNFYSTLEVVWNRCNQSTWITSFLLIRKYTQQGTNYMLSIDTYKSATR